MSTQPVSIIIALPGDPAQALACLEAVGAQPDDPAFDVVVVPTAPDIEPLLARLEGDVQIVRAGPPGSHITLAAAVAAALPRVTGDTVVLLRDGARPRRGWLSSLIASVNDGEAGLSSSAGPIVSSRSLALPRPLLASLELPVVDDELFFAGLALAVAGRGIAVRSARASGLDPAASPTASARFLPRAAPELTVVIPTLDASSPRVAGCLRAIAACTDVPYEVVIVDNGASPQGFSDPVNAGIRAARTPYVVVMNDDVVPLAGWWAPLRNALDAGAVVAFPQTVHGAMRHDFPAWCFAFGERARTEFAHGAGEFLDPHLVVWFQDTDLYVRLRAAGVPPVLAPGSRILHGLSKTVASPDPQLRRWVEQQVSIDRVAFITKHPTVNLTPTQAAA